MPFEDDLLANKIYGQPFLPKDLPQLLFLGELYINGFVHKARQYTKYTYLQVEQPWGYIALAKDVVFVAVIFWCASAILTPLWVYGPLKVLCDMWLKIQKRGAAILMSLPSVKRKVDAEVAKTEKVIDEKVVKNDPVLTQFPSLPASGLGAEDIVREVETQLTVLDHSDWESGRVSGAVYHGGADLLKLQLKMYEMYSVANQLHPDVFPGIRKMEAEVVAMVLDLFNAPELGCGTTTSGGTESLLLTGLAAREYGKKIKGITRPEVIAPITVHAGIEKACDYFGMKLHKVDLNPKTYQVDTLKVKKLINSNTVLLVGSAPNYPHGIIDDISALSKLAVKYNIPLHVDACLGLFIVTFLERSKVHGSKKIPLFDFRLPGVTSISCDTHKYGFAPKGSSIIMYRTPELRQCQYYVLSSWTGGMYGSPTLAGSRPGALMAGCWATLVHIGASGYEKSCYDIVSVTNTARRAIESESLLKSHLMVLGDPIASVIAFTTRPGSKVNIYLLGDSMTKKGWHLASLQNPAALHFAFTRLSVPAINEFIADLIEAVKELKDTKNPSLSDTAALYGVAGSISTAGIADRIIVAFLDALYKL